MKEISFVVDFDEKVSRIDSYLAQKTNFSRSSIVKFIQNDGVFVNGGRINKRYIPRVGDKIVVLPPVCSAENIVVKEIPIDIVYEDNFLIVVNKQKGIVTHPAIGHYDDTLVSALMFYTKNLSDLNGEFRPGIVHRLDKDTSGLLVVAKNNFAHENLAKQIKNKTAKRIYLGIVHGIFKNFSGVVDLPIGRNIHNRKKMAVTDKNSKSATTHYEVLKSFKKYSLVKFSLETGRTHQIRVHLSKIGHPLAGDTLYGGKNDPEFLCGQCLHAYKMEFDHPYSGKKMSFFTPLPDYFKKFLCQIF